MFDVSFTEMMVIGVVALIVIGPERLPKVAKTVGHLLGRAQRYVNDVKGDIRREIELDELRKFKSEMDEAAQSVQASLRETEDVMTRQGEQLREVIDQTAREARAGATSDTPSIMPPIPATGEAAAAPSAPDANRPASSLPAADDPLRTAALRAETETNAETDGLPVSTSPVAAAPSRAVESNADDGRADSAQPAAVRRNDSPPPPTWSRP